MGTAGVYGITVIVGAHYSSSYLETSVNTRVIIPPSPSVPGVARGWSIGGIQRLITVGDSALVWDSDGSAAYFLRSGSTSFTNACWRLLAPHGLGIGGVRSTPARTQTPPKQPSTTLGNMTRVTDRWANLAKFAYDGSMRLTNVYDPADTTRSIVLTYRTQGLDSIRDPFGRGTRITLDTAHSTLTAIRDPDGLATSFAYDGSYRLNRIINRRGDTVTTIGYHSLSNRVVADSGPAIAVYGGGTARPIVTFNPWQHRFVPYDTSLLHPTADRYRGCDRDRRWRAFHALHD